MNGIIPQALKDRPVLDWHTGRYYDAFVRLKNQADGNIQVSEIESFARIHGETDIESMLNIIIYADSALRAEQVEKSGNKLSVKNGRVIKHS